MSREEALQRITAFRDYLCAGNPIWDVDECREAFGIAIAAMTAEKVGNIAFTMLRELCRFHALRYHDYNVCEEACHYLPNIPDGDSWGDCNEHNCPFWAEGEEE